MAQHAGTKDDPWQLKTPPLSSDYQMYFDDKDGQPVIVCVVGKTTLLYDRRAIDDLHKMLQERGDWVELGSADEQKPAKDGTVEAWARSADNPLGGWYGLKKACAAALACTCRHLWKRWALRKSSTTPVATACGL